MTTIPGISGSHELFMLTVNAAAVAGEVSARNVEATLQNHGYTVCLAKHTGPKSS